MYKENRQSSTDYRKRNLGGINEQKNSFFRRFAKYVRLSLCESDFFEHKNYIQYWKWFTSEIIMFV